MFVVVLYMESVLSRIYFSKGMVNGDLLQAAYNCGQLITSGSFSYEFYLFQEIENFTFSKRSIPPFSSQKLMISNAASLRFCWFRWMCLVTASRRLSLRYSPKIFPPFPKRNFRIFGWPSSAARAVAVSSLFVLNSISFFCFLRRKSTVSKDPPATAKCSTVQLK